MFDSVYEAGLDMTIFLSLDIEIPLGRIEIPLWRNGCVGVARGRCYGRLHILDVKLAVGSSPSGCSNASTDRAVHILTPTGAGAQGSGQHPITVDKVLVRRRFALDDVCPRIVGGRTTACEPVC